MTAPISNDLRERVVAAVSSGESVRAVAARFGVAASSVVKWAQRIARPDRFARPRWAVIESAYLSRIATSLPSGSLKIHI